MFSRRKLSVVWITFISVALVLGTAFAYYNHFASHSFKSSSPQDWGMFGDFFGGFLGTLIGILNLIVLVYLTNSVAEQDSRTTLNQFRFEFYLKLKDGIDEFNANSHTVSDLDKMDLLIHSLKDYSFLFNDQLSSYTNNVDNLKTAFRNLNNWKYGHIPRDRPREAYIPEFIHHRAAFLNFIQKTMINK